jgi:hypothetical protein
VITPGEFRRSLTRGDRRTGVVEGPRRFGLPDPQWSHALAGVPTGHDRPATGAGLLPKREHRMSDPNPVAAVQTDDVDRQRRARAARAAAVVPAGRRGFQTRRLDRPRRRVHAAVASIRDRGVAQAEPCPRTSATVLSGESPATAGIFAARQAAVMQLPGWWFRSERDDGEALFEDADPRMTCARGWPVYDPRPSSGRTRVEAGCEDLEMEPWCHACPLGGQASA